MIRVKDEAGAAKLAAAIAEKLKAEKEERLERERALGCVRRAALWTTYQWWFSQLSLTLIVVFSVMLAFYDPTDPDNETPGNKFISKVEKIFIGIFTLEVLVVWLADGFFRFFDEPWNTLDFIIVGVGYLSLTPVGANLGALRTIRLLRPLRSLKRIPSMRLLVNSMLAALPGLVNVGVMITAFLIVTSLFGVKMFKGIMVFGCVPTDDYDGTVLRALTVADEACAACVASCVAPRGSSPADVARCANKTIVGEAACTSVLINNSSASCTYVPATTPDWESLGVFSHEGDGCEICQQVSPQVETKIILRERYDRARTVEPRGRPQKGSCASAADEFPSDVRNGTASSDSYTQAKDSCEAAGLCAFSGGLNDVPAQCEPEYFTARYLKAMNESDLLTHFGVPEKVEEMDLRAYGLDRYEKVCNGFLESDEKAAGYSEKCDEETVAQNTPHRVFTLSPSDECGAQPRYCPCDCMEGYLCVRDGGPNYGISSFDNMGQAILTVFQIITLEGWTEILDRLTDMSADALVIIYFVVIVWGGAFFLTHYLLAMICLEFTKKMKGTVQAGEMMEDEDDDGIFDKSVAPWGGCYRACRRVCASDPEKVRVKKAHKMQIFVWFFARYGQLSDEQRASAEGYTGTQPDPDNEDDPGVPWPPTHFPDWSELSTAQQNAAADLGMSAETWPPPQPSAITKARMMLVKFTSLSIFDTFINSLILVNFAMLMIDHHGMDEDTVTMFEDVNNVFTWIFAGEMVLKQIGLGLSAYFDDSFNCFDSFIVLTSFLEKVGDGGGSFSVLRTLRLLRILKSFKMISGLDTLKKVMATTAGSMSAIVNFAVLLMLLLYIFALVGMQMFGGKLEIEGETGRPNFDNLIWSFTSVFLVMTRENWQALLYDTMHATGPAAFLYYYALIVSTSYVLLALFVGTLLENFEKFFLAREERKERKKRVAGRKFLRKLNLKRGKKTIPMVDEDVADLAQKWKKKAGAKKAFPSPSGGMGAASLLGAGVLGTPGKYAAAISEEKAPEPESAPSPAAPSGILHSIRQLRQFARRVVDSAPFETAVIVAILLSSFCLAYEHPTDKSDSTKIKVLKVLDLIFIVFFTFEMSIKILAHGLIRGKEAYLRSGWNMLDGFIVVTALIVLITDIEGGFFRIIRTVRVLRPLRAIQRSPGMRAVAGGLFKAVPSILTVAMLCFFFMLICAIFCVQMFKGTMYYCTDPNCASPDLLGGCGGSESEYIGNTEDAVTGGDRDGQNCPMSACTGTFVDSVTGELTNSEWVNSQWNFDNVPNALLALFEIFALEAWPDILLALVDATDECHGPRKDSQVGAVWLFVIMILLGAFFLLNLFVGVIVTAYNDVQGGDESSDEDEKAKAERHKQSRDADIVTLVGMAKPQKKTYLDYRYRGPFMRITNARWFEPVIMFIIVLNVAMMGVDWPDEHGQTPTELSKVIEGINLFFTASFTVEMVIKLISYFPKAYFADTWNVFDFIITTVSLVEVAFPLPLNPSLIRIFRIARLARLLRLSKGAKGLKTLIKTFSATLPSLGHVGFLLMIFFFMYAVLGVQLFWNLERGELVNDYTNFDDFGNAIYTLFRLSTGENWNGVMHECMLAEPDCDPDKCQLGSTELEVDQVWQGEEWGGGKKACEDLGGEFIASNCGSAAGSFYHITFLVICAFTTLNLIIAVILFAFFDMSESDSQPTLEGDKIAVFEDAWADLDKNAQGEVSESHLTKLLLANGIPLGVKKFDETEEYKQELWETGLLFDRNGKIQFRELLNAMVKVSFGVDVPAAELKREAAKKRKQLSTVPSRPVTTLGEAEEGPPVQSSQKQAAADGAAGAKQAAVAPKLAPVQPSQKMLLSDVVPESPIAAPSGSSVPPPDAQMP